MESVNPSSVLQMDQVTHPSIIFVRSAAVSSVIQIIKLLQINNKENIFNRKLTKKNRY
jgi:hypothetical protein